MKYAFVIGLFTAMTLSACGDSKKETESTDEQESPKVEVKSVGELTIGYYDMAKIATDFDFYVSTQKSLEKKKASFDSKLSVQQKAYESAGMALQKGMNNNTLSPNQIAGYQDKMRKAEEETFRLQQQEGMALEQESMKANEVLIGKIESYAKDFAEKNGIKLFLSKAVGGQVTYVDSTFNMTDSFIDFMNKKEKKIEEEIK